MNNKARVIAFYLPQFHPIEENNRWWGEGFTEWTNVGKARALYRNHYQPKVPADLGYYDLRVAETREAQAQMARRYGVEGFCYWHYWFGEGKRLLERPFNEVLMSGKPDFPFCLAWANESWKGFFHGLKSVDSLIEQRYLGVEDYTRHFYDVLPAFKDKRYITVDGKPLFMVYKPMEHPEMKLFIDLWRRLAVENGLDGIYFVAHSYFLKEQRSTLEEMGFDAINVVRLFDYKTRNPRLHKLSRLRHKWLKQPFIVPYAKAMQYFVDRALDSADDVFPTVIPNWDHSPRSLTNALVLDASTPELFDAHVAEAMTCIEGRSDDKRIIFVKSWNEWGEGNYLEPDLKYGRRYLEVLAKHILS